MGKMKSLKMGKRVGGRPLPEVQLVDMTDTSSMLPEPPPDPTSLTRHRKDDIRILERKVLSKPLLEAMRDTFERSEQVIILLNRRGYSPFVQCLSCGYALHCPNCSVSLNYHQDTRLMHCHYCDFARPLPSQCPKCEKATIGLLGIGTERLTELLSSHFPDRRIERLDRIRGVGRSSARCFVSLDRATFMF